MPETRIIHLWPDGSAQNNVHMPESGKVPNGWHDPSGRPFIEVYAPTASIHDSGAKRACVIVCPGGGYGGLARHEGEPLARLFALHGIYGVVLKYRVAPNRFPTPYNDACRAVRLVRHLSDELGIDPQRVGLMGFSAGGHLASTVATQPSLHLDPDDDLAGKISARPDRVILGYPVISFVTRHHGGSAANLLGPDASVERRTQLSNELHVTKENPAAFIFHTADDAAVPVENALMFAAACAANAVSCELHSYRSGRHGVGLALDNPALCSWSGLLIDWLADWKQPKPAPAP